MACQKRIVVYMRFTTIALYFCSQAVRPVFRSGGDGEGGLEAGQRKKDREQEEEREEGVEGRKERYRERIVRGKRGDREEC